MLHKSLVLRTCIICRTTRTIVWMSRNGPGGRIKLCGRDLALVSHRGLYRGSSPSLSAFSLFRCLAVVILHRCYMLHSEYVPLLKVDEVFQLQVRWQNSQALFHFVEFIPVSKGLLAVTCWKHVPLFTGWDTHDFFSLWLVGVSMSWTYLK